MPEIISDDEIRLVTQVEKDEQGRITLWVEEQRDLDNVLIGRRVDEYAYYDTGEIDTIVQSVYDGEGSVLSKKEVKHYKDNRQPVVTGVVK